MSFSFNLPCDNEGYVEYDCPFCKTVFRLNQGLFQGERGNDELFCPYCNLKSSVQNFYTTECVEYMAKMRVYLQKVYLDNELKTIAKKSKGLLKYTNKKRPSEPDIFGLHPEIDTKHYCPKCNNSFKIRIGANIIYCPYCGDVL